MDQWQRHPGRSIRGYETSPAISPQHGDSAWKEEVREALGRLEIGQTLNRKAGEVRVSELRQHMDERIGDLRQDVTRRIDRLEDRVLVVEQRRPEPPQASPMPPSVVAMAPTTPPPPGSTLDWLRTINWREPAVWALVFMAALDLIKADVVVRLLQAVLGVLQVPR